MKACRLAIPNILKRMEVLKLMPEAADEIERLRESEELESSDIGRDPKFVPGWYLGPALIALWLTALILLLRLG